VPKVESWNIISANSKRSEDGFHKLRFWAAEWGDSHDVDHVSKQEVSKFDIEEYSHVFDLHFGNGFLFLYSSPQFESYQWNFQRWGSLQKSASLVEHLFFSFEILMPAAFYLANELPSRGKRSLGSSKESLDCYWQSAPERNTSALIRLSMESDWVPGLHTPDGHVEGEAVDVLSFDGEMMGLDQLHAFLRLFLDTYLGSSGIYAEIVAIHDPDESWKTTKVVIRQAPGLKSSLVLQIVDY
jgi:hypothetical protein